MDNENNNPSTFNVSSIPEQYRPVSVWAFVGYQILFMIPCVGLICAIVFACGGINNENIKNYARANLVLIAIVIILYVLLFFVIGVSIGMLGGQTGTISSIS